MHLLSSFTPLLIQQFREFRVFVAVEISVELANTFVDGSEGMQFADVFSLPPKLGIHVVMRKYKGSRLICLEIFERSLHEALYLVWNRNKLLGSNLCFRLC
jgi:hypothetical protein